MIVEQEKLLESYDIIKNILECNEGHEGGWYISSYDIQRIKRLLNDK